MQEAPPSIARPGKCSCRNGDSDNVDEMLSCTRLCTNMGTAVSKRTVAYQPSRIRGLGPTGRHEMPETIVRRVNRRSVLHGAAALGAAQVTSPFLIQARGEIPVKIGFVDPLTGVYAAIAQSEVEGAKLALEHINKKGGILGRQVEVLIEDSANDVGTGVQKTRKLIERDQVAGIIGDVNSGIALAMAGVTSEKNMLHIVSGGHTDVITGKDCHWNVFRVCNTTTMDVNAI